MDWKLALIFATVVLVIFAGQRLLWLPGRAARRYLSEGALVLDVRTPEEFKSGHLDGAVNIPLDELQDRVGQRVPDRSRVLLLHCLAGTRSGIARRILRGMGYTKAFNLGSYGRARRIVNGN